MVKTFPPASLVEDGVSTLGKRSGLWQERTSVALMAPWSQVTRSSAPLVDPPCAMFRMANAQQIAALQQAVATHKNNLAAVQAAALGSPYDELASQAAEAVLVDKLKTIFQAGSVSPAARPAAKAKRR